MHENHYRNAASRVRGCGRVIRLLTTHSAIGLVVSCGGAAPRAQAPAPAQQPADELTHTADGASARDASEQDAAEEMQSAPAAPYDGVESDEATIPEEHEQAKARRADMDKSIDGYDLPKSLAAIDVFEARLSATIELKEPACEQAETFRRAVCQLAERICALEQPLPSSVERHCVDSRARCANATSRYRAGCER